MSSTPALMIAGTHSGCGKTTLSMGLMHAFSQAGLAVQAFKAGPDFIDPLFHGALTGRPSRNLDSFLMGEGGVRRCFARAAADADLAVAEGVMGMYDGSGADSAGSSAELARLLGLPVVLAVDAAGAGRSAAALVKGFAGFEPLPGVAAVVLNRLAGEGHYRLVKQAIEGECGLPVLGWLGRVDSLPERHLGLVPAGELADFRAGADRLAQAIRRSVDLDGLLALARARTAGAVAGGGFEPDGPLAAADAPGMRRADAGRPVRVAVARDDAFNFYYADNLDLLAALGAEIVPFSPLRDRALPAGCAGVYLGGGFPEEFAERLEANAALRRDLLDFAQSGGPVYAECGGLLYLCARLQGRAMVGFFPGEARMTDRLQRFGYCRVEALADTPLAPAGWRGVGHEFHHSLIEGMDGVQAVWRVSAAGRPREDWSCGFLRGRTLAAYAHLHFAACPELPRRWLDQCRAFASGGRP